MAARRRSSISANLWKKVIEIIAAAIIGGLSISIDIDINVFIC
jgi:hypothetical protein